jgi:hypothetical protein
MTNHPNRALNSNYYANTTTADLERFVVNLAPRAMPNFFDSADSYQSYIGRTREEARRLKIINAELAFRAAHPGAYEAGQESKKRQKAMFGY